MSKIIRRENGTTVTRDAKDIIDSTFGDNNTMRTNAECALAEMKSLEAERRNKMVECRIDRHTVVCATPERLEEIKKELKVR